MYRVTYGEIRYYNLMVSLGAKDLIALLPTVKLLAQKMVIPSSISTCIIMDWLVNKTHTIEVKANFYI